MKLTGWTTHDERSQFITGTLQTAQKELREQAQILRALAKVYGTLTEAARCAVANAVVGPDAAMDGATDCYHVPLEDVDALRRALEVTE